jgi:hypothetical protein
MHSKNRSRLGHCGAEDTATTNQKHGPDLRIDREHTSHRHLSKGDAKRYPLRIVYLIAGLACIVLGLIGILIPGLPTTPFILLASWCFTRSSRRLENALLRSRLFGPFIRDWRQHRAIRRPTRYLAVGLVATMMLTTCVLSDFGYALKASIAVLACIGLLVIVRIPVLPIDAPDESTRIDAVTSSISNKSL